VAKKVAGSNSYPLDVIGYSDDGLLNVTSRKNSFLQNVASNNNHFAGNIATISGLNNIDDLGISTNPLSTKNQYFQENEITNPAGDHYIINNAPLVTSTSFQEYVIPLEIYEDQVSIGKSRAYNISPMFENLYIDLYPIPSGASISTAYLVVTYKPSNALQLHTFGQAQSSELVLRNLKLLPSSSSGTQIIHNINSSSLAPLPHAYSYSSGVTTNYSNRWKGVDGNVVWGPFNPDQFSADFYNPPSDNPFTYGYYNFNHIEEIFNLLYPSGLVHLISRESIPNTPSSNSTNTLVWLGGITAKIQDQNIGYRLNNSSIFSEPTPNKTIDWTKTNSQQNINITINDSFDRFVNVGRFGNLPRLTDNSTPFNYKNGFACYIRFTPSNQAISNSYDLFNSGVIATFGNISGDTTNNLTIKYGNGYLNVTCKDTNDNYISISDTAHYSEYTYPLSLLITYLYR